MPRPPGRYLAKRHCLALKLYCERTGTLQETMAKRLGMGRVRFSQIVNRYRPANRRDIGEAERMAGFLMMNDPELAEAVDAQVEAEKNAPISEDELLRKIRKLPDHRKAVVLQKVGEIIRNEKV